MMGLLACGLVLRIWDPVAVAKLRYMVFDTYQRISPNPAKSDFKVRVVDIDEASLEKVGQWPWPRTRLAEIVERLHASGAAVIAFDIILAEPDRLSPDNVVNLFEVPEQESAELRRLAAQLPSNDARLAKAMSQAPVVLALSGVADGTAAVPKPVAGFAAAGDQPNQFVPSFPAATPSLPGLVEMASGLGAANWLPAHDQVVRAVPSLVEIAGTLFPSLSLEALRVASGSSTIVVKSSGGSGLSAFGQKTGVELARTGDTVLDTDGDGQVWLRFGMRQKERYIAAHEVLSGTYADQGIAGKLVLIGASATGLMDLQSTPLESAVPGVEIHAQALEQMIDGSYLRRPAYATGLELAYLLAAGMIVIWLIARFGPLPAALAGLAALAAITAASWSSYANAGILLDPVYPTLATVLIYLGGSLFSYIRSEAERHRVRAAFSHYVAPQLVEELADNPEKLKLGGEMREVTLLFSDVRGFSRLSERMQAEELIRFVNALFTPLSDIILEEQGTIDKFMGDAVMAFWNAPVAMPDHAVLACRAALRMQAALDQLNATWANEAVSAAIPAEPVRIGIGLNTGRCCVGNVGSPERFDYSLLGDPVNTAARLESETKSFGVPIIAGARTVALAPGFAFLPIGEIALRGKDKPETVFALLGDEELAATERFQKLVEVQMKLLEVLSDGNHSQKHAALKAAASRNQWPQLDTLYAAYRARL